MAKPGEPHARSRVSTSDTAAFPPAADVADLPPSPSCVVAGDAVTLPPATGERPRPGVAILADEQVGLAVAIEVSEPEKTVVGSGACCRVSRQVDC